MNLIYVPKAKRIWLRLGYSEQDFNNVLREIGNTSALIHPPTFKQAMFIVCGLKAQVFNLFVRFYKADKNRLRVQEKYFDVLYDAEQTVYTDDVSRAIRSVAKATGTKYLSTALARLERMKRFNNG